MYCHHFTCEVVQVFSHHDVSEVILDEPLFVESVFSAAQKARDF